MVCSKCFKLHSQCQFAEEELPREPQERLSYSRPPPIAQNQWGGLHSPRGVVDLCPCIKLTIGKRRSTIAYLRTVGVHSTVRPVNGPRCCHECRKCYKDIEIQVKVNPFLRQDGELGADLLLFLDREDASGSFLDRPNRLSLQ